MTIPSTFHGRIELEHFGTKEINGWEFKALANKKAERAKKQTNQIGKKKQQEKGLNDLLLPVLLCLVVLPLCVRLKVYSTGLGQYDFYPQIDISYDFYTYYRSRLFYAGMAITLLVWIIYRLLYKAQARPWKTTLLPLGGFAFLTMLSAIFSVDKHLSFFGSESSNQSVWVIIGYIVLLLYTYEMVRTEHDHKLILGGLAIIGGIFILIGLMQCMGAEPLNFEAVQRLCMSSADAQQYVGKVGNTFSEHYVFLTLFNPNYAAMVLAMGIVFCSGMFLTASQDKKRERMVYLVYILAFFVLLYFTYSRMGLVALAGGLIACVLLAGVSKKTWMQIIAGVAAMLVLLAGLELVSGFRLLHRLTDEKMVEEISSIVTDADGVHVTSRGKEEVYTLQPGETSLTLDLLGEQWTFLYEDGTYCYVNPFGKHQVLEPVEKTDLHGLESFASGRGYFWSRLLPKLKKSWLIGTGMDTMMVVFPQDDYVGRLIYSKDLAMICDRAHNGYLQTAIESGLLALVLLLGFTGYALCKLVRSIRRKTKEKRENEVFLLSQRIGISSLGAVITYLISLCTNDITIFTMPFACIFMGLAMAAFDEKRSI